jgi:hypothetical protein
MARHEDLLQQGPQEAPEPETAEERSKRLGMGTAAGGAVVAGGAAAAKLGGLKGFLWIFAWLFGHALWRAGVWVALAVVLGALLTVFVIRARREG